MLVYQMGVDSVRKKNGFIPKRKGTSPTRNCYVKRTMAALQRNVLHKTGKGYVRKQYWYIQYITDILQQYSGTQNGQWILSKTILIYQMLE
jgi:predicted RNA-binding protein YlxR (DUF448 family)